MIYSALIYVHIYDIYAAIWMNLENIAAKWKKPDTKNHILYGSIYMKCPEKTNP